MFIFKNNGDHLCGIVFDPGYQIRSFQRRYMAGQEGLAR